MGMVAAIPAVAETCDCALRSFWEGLCTKHSEAVPATIGGWHEYANYSNFSQAANAQAWDQMISDCAEELGRRAGEDIRTLYAHAFDAMPQQLSLFN